jgi:hydrogenase expression/formation protein HypC
MKLVKKDGDEGIAASGGLKRRVNLSLLKNAKTGDYVLIHAGFAIQKVDEKEAHKTLKAIREVKT